MSNLCPKNKSKIVILVYLSRFLILTTVIFTKLVISLDIYDNQLQFDI